MAATEVPGQSHHASERFCVCRLEYVLEVMREGTILGSRPIAEKDHYTFGRTPENGAWPPAEP